MERLPDFIRARLWLLARSKPPPNRLLAALRELKGISIVPAQPDYTQQIVDKRIRAAVEGKLPAG